MEIILQGLTIEVVLNVKSTVLELQQLVHRLIDSSIRQFTENESGTIHFIFNISFFFIFNMNIFIFNFYFQAFLVEVLSFFLIQDRTLKIFNCLD